MSGCHYCHGADKSVKGCGRTNHPGFVDLTVNYSGYANQSDTPAVTEEWTSHQMQIRHQNFHDTNMCPNITQWSPSSPIRHHRVSFEQRNHCEVLNYKRWEYRIPFPGDFLTFFFFKNCNKNCLLPMCNRFFLSSLLPSPTPTLTKSPLPGHTTPLFSPIIFLSLLVVGRRLTIYLPP